MEPVYEVKEIDSVFYIVNLRDFDSLTDAYWLVERAAEARNDTCRLLGCVKEPIGVQIVYKKERALISLGGTRFDQLLPFSIMASSNDVEIDIKNGFLIELKGETKEQVAKTLRQEMAHVTFWQNRFSKKYLPARGVDEASAILIDGDLVERAFRSREYFGVRQILTSTDYPDSKLKQSQLYDNASSLLLFLLLERGGLELWREFTEASVDLERGFTEKTFSDIYRINFHQLESEWREWRNKSNPLTFKEWMDVNYKDIEDRFNYLYSKLNSPDLFNSLMEMEELQKLIAGRREYKLMWQEYYNGQIEKWEKRLDDLKYTTHNL